MSSGHFALSWGLNSTLKVVSKATTSWGYILFLKSVTIVPISAPSQNSRNEKYIQTSIANCNLHHLTKNVARRVQEEVVDRGMILH